MSKSKKHAGRAGARRAPKGLQGRRFTDEQREHALTLVASGVAREQVATTLSTTTQSVRRWVTRAIATGTMPKVPAGKSTAAPAPVAQPKSSSTEAPPPRARSPYAPADPAHGLSDPEVAAILEWKKRHPSMGPAQLRAQLKRFKGWRLSIKAIARVLRGHGYELVHRKSRPQGPEPVRFEAPRRNALWQMDFCEVRLGEGRVFVLLVLDDFSRFVVGHAVSDAPSSAVATATFRSAMARHGKPEAVRTDRGGGFVAYTKEGDFARVLEVELVDHIVGRSYSPKGGGKVESGVGTLKRELWECFHFEDRDEAERRVAEFFADYNHRRAHMGIDGLTPADRFFGRADEVLARVDAVSRKRQGTLDAASTSGAPLEEVLAARTGSPLEVLRLVLDGGVMELRFCGARIRLGRVEP
jgi:transposase InsO family protein